MMKAKLMFGAGLAVGYIMWSSKGQAAFRKFKNEATTYWRSPAVQHQVHDATEAVKEKAPDVVDKVTSLARKAAAAAGIGSASGEPRSWDSAAARRGDVISDPARNSDAGHDWTDEGGATPAGPATNVDPRKTSESGA